MPLAIVVWPLTGDDGKDKDFPQVNVVSVFIDI
jgi:hypothetical protein